MQSTADITALIGFGEAGQTFAAAGGWGQRVRVHDRLTDADDTRPAKLGDYAAHGVVACDSMADAVADAGLVISLVTADQALVIATQAARWISPGALFCDLNSVAPETKRSAAEAIAAAGAHYVDVAVMSPVQPAALAAPLLLSGPRVEDAERALAELGFTNIRIVGAQVGHASSIKMIRSVMVKGIEALSVECVLAASEAAVLDDVIASLDASWPGADWGARADYNLDRMMAHGQRRAAEMQEVVRTLDDLGVGSAMSRGTVERQASIGGLGVKTPPQGLVAKISMICNRKIPVA